MWCWPGAETRLAPPSALPSETRYPTSTMQYSSTTAPTTRGGNWLCLLLFFFSLLKEFTNWGEFLDYRNLWCFETETFRGKNSPFFRKSERPPWNLFFYFFNCCSSWDPSTYLHISIFKSNQQSGKLQIEMGAIFIGPERLKTWLRPV